MSEAKEKCVLKNDFGYCFIRKEICHPETDCVLLVRAYMTGKEDEPLSRVNRELKQIYGPGIEEEARVKRIIAASTGAGG